MKANNNYIYSINYNIDMKDAARAATVRDKLKKEQQRKRMAKLGVVAWIMGMLR